MKPNEIECTKETMDAMEANDWDPRTPEREKKVAYQYYIDGLTLDAIAKLEGNVTRERVRQIRNKAVRRLNRYIFIKQNREKMAKRKAQDPKQIGIEEIKLSPRTFNCLRRNGVETVGDIVKMFPDAEHLLRVWQLGKKTALEIVGMLDELGVKHNFDKDIILEGK